MFSFAGSNSTCSVRIVYVDPTTYIHTSDKQQTIIYFTLSIIFSQRHVAPDIVSSRINSLRLFIIPTFITVYTNNEYRRNFWRNWMNTRSRFKNEGLCEGMGFSNFRKSFIFFEKSVKEWCFLFENSLCIKIKFNYYTYIRFNNVKSFIREQLNRLNIVNFQNNFFEKRIGKI